jgi:hypothetical protein
MPPIEASTRGALLTGVSALALAGWTPVADAAEPLPAWQVWIEGGSFETNGGSMFGGAFPGIASPIANPGLPHTGWEMAAGFDYREPNSPWHFVFDIRGGQSRGATQNSSSSQSSFSSFHSSFFHSSTTVQNNTVSSTAQERESHIVADFMVGRDYGLGHGLGQIQFGFRVADLFAVTQQQLNAAQTITTNSFYVSSFSNTRHLLNSSVVGSSQAAVGTFKSRFFGAGPRVAFTDSVPVWGRWTFDFAGGMAALAGDRTLKVSITESPGGLFGSQFGGSAVIFNADAWVGFSYAFTPQFKMTAGLRTDYYDSALIAFNPYTGGLQMADRNFWGPFLRLTGKF